MTVVMRKFDASNSISEYSSRKNFSSKEKHIEMIFSLPVDFEFQILTSLSSSTDIKCSPNGSRL